MHTEVGQHVGIPVDADLAVERDIGDVRNAAQVLAHFVIEMGEEHRAQNQIQRDQPECRAQADAERHVARDLGAKCRHSARSM